MTVVVVVVMVLLILIMLIIVTTYIIVVVVVVVDNTKWFDGDNDDNTQPICSECWTFYPQILSDHASILMLLVYLT